MCNQSEWIVREAFRAYAQGDVARMMDFVHPDLEWTSLDPVRDDSPSQTRQGRAELEEALAWLASRGLRSELEQVIAAGDKVMLVLRTPGLSKHRRHPVSDRTYDVLTIRHEQIVGLQECQDRAAARSLIGIG
jgi:ketosteroid isomerase-like protein